MVYYEAIWGLPGSGKTSHAKSQIEIPKTIVLGNGTRFREFFEFQWGGIGRHKKDYDSIGLEHRDTNYKRILEDISRLDKPQAIIESWSGFFYQSCFRSFHEINEKIDKIYDSFERNNNLEKVFMICDSFAIFMPFKMHKKVALWNKRAFAKADKVVEMKCGIPIVIKGPNQI